MCGRYFRKLEKLEIAERFLVGKVFEEPLGADYNIAPATFQPVVRLSRGSGEVGAGERELALLRWGMVPHFATALKDFKGMTTFNARAELVAASATWKESLRRRRCLVPADGFYEWAEKVVEVKAGARVKPAARPAGRSQSRSQSKSGRQPFAITLADGGAMAFAGLWDAWKEPKKSPQEVDRWLQSFAIVTTEANEAMAPICERMPVILAEKDWEEWLDRDEGRAAPMHLLRPFAAEEMKVEACNTAVGNVRNHGPEMLHSA
jgi:putative SOS response-associated peptidase YedK